MRRNELFGAPGYGKKGQSQQISRNCPLLSANLIHLITRRCLVSTSLAACQRRNYGSNLWDSCTPSNYL